MSTLVILAAGLAWLGASLTSLSEARRGLALGLALTGAGLGGAVLATRPLGALVLTLSGVLAGLLRLRGGANGWGVLPAGSTPSIVLCVVVLVASLVLGGTLFQGNESAPSVAALAVALVAAVQLLGSRRRQPALAIGSTLALGLGAFGSTGDILGGSLVAVALAAIPAAEAEEVPT